MSLPPRRRVTMRALASLAGVSAMTVSRALRGDPAVSPALASKIQALAQSQGYKPDPRLQALMQHLRSRSDSGPQATLAGITDLRSQERQPYFKQVVASAKARALELGFGFELFRVEKPQEPDSRLERILLTRGIQGLLLLQMRSPVQVDKLLPWERFSVVIATPSVASPDFPRVGPNHFNNARLLVAKLLAQGFKRPGFITTPTYSSRTGSAYEAALALLLAPKNQVPRLLLRSQETLDAQFAPWLKQHRPDCLILYLDALIPRLQALLPPTACPPLPIASTSLSSASPATMGIEEHQDLIGHHAVELLAGMLARHQKACPSQARLLIDGSWREAPLHRAPSPGPEAFHKSPLLL